MLLPLTVLLVMLKAPPLWPLPREDIILGFGPLRQLYHIPGQPGGPCLPRGPRLQAQGSNRHRDPGRRPLHLIMVSPKPQTCLRGPLSGDLTSPTTPFRGMFTAGIEIFMLLIQRYHREPFMVPRQFYYPRVVTEFYHTMTSKREANPTALHFSIDGRPGILRAFDIIASLHLPVVLANAAGYR